MRRRVIAVMCTGLLSAGMFIPAPASAEPMPSGTFKSCKQLRAEYSAGIAKNPKAARKIVKKGYKRPIVCKRVYRQVQKKLDRNRNRVACETR